MADITTGVPPATTGDSSPTSKVLVDRISDLPEALLLQILSFLPTHRAAQTSLLSRQFRNLWLASPSVYLYGNTFRVGARFIEMVDRSLVGRDFFAPVERFHISDPRCILPLESVVRLISSIHTLRVKNLSLKLLASTASEICSTIFSSKFLESLVISTPYFQFVEALVPKSIACTRLKSLTITLNINSADLTRLVSGLPVLEYLNLLGITNNDVEISSQSVKTLRLQCFTRKIKLCFPNLDCMDLRTTLRGLEVFQGEMPLVGKAKFSLCSPFKNTTFVLGSMLKSVMNVAHLELCLEEARMIFTTDLNYCETPVTLPRLEFFGLSCNTCDLKLFQVEMPVLRKADLQLLFAAEEDSLSMRGLLKCVENAVELKLHIVDHMLQVKPFRIFGPNKVPPLFPRLVCIKIQTCCHEATIQDVIRLLENSPMLNCLKMDHMDPFICEERHKKKMHWQSKLPRNSKGNFQHGYFTDLHTRDGKTQVIKLLSRRLISNKRKRLMSNKRKI